MKKVQNPALDKYRLRRKPKRNSNFEYLSKFYSRAIFFITSGQKNKLAEFTFISKKSVNFAKWVTSKKWPILEANDFEVTYFSKWLFSKEYV